MGPWQRIPPSPPVFRSYPPLSPREKPLKNRVSGLRECASAEACIPRCSPTARRKVAWWADLEEIRGQPANKVGRRTPWAACLAFRGLRGVAAAVDYFAEEVGWTLDLLRKGSRGSFPRQKLIALLETCGAPQGEGDKRRQPRPPARLRSLRREIAWPRSFGPRPI